MDSRGKNENSGIVVGLGERLKFALICSRVSTATFARAIGVSQAMVSFIFTDQRRVSAKVLKKLNELTNVDLNWVITGIGSPPTYQDKKNAC